MTLLNIAGLGWEFEGIRLYNPTIKEISDKINDEENFFFALKMLSTSLLDMLPIETPDGITDFNILVTLLLNQKDNFKTFSLEKLKAMKDLLQLIFKNYDDNISISQEEIIFSNKNENFIIINKENFSVLQNCINEMFKISFLFGGTEDKDDYNPASERAKLIAEKLKRNREKVAEINGNLTNNKTSIIENYIMIISVGLNLNPNQVSDLTLYQLLTLFERVKMKIEWDLDISCRLAGGNPDDHPDHWMSIL